MIPRKRLENLRRKNEEERKARVKSRENLVQLLTVLSGLILTMSAAIIASSNLKNPSDELMLIFGALFLMFLIFIIVHYLFAFIIRDPVNAFIHAIFSSFLFSFMVLVFFKYILEIECDFSGSLFVIGSLTLVLLACLTPDEIRIKISDRLSNIKLKINNVENKKSILFIMFVFMFLSSLFILRVFNYS